MSNKKFSRPSLARFTAIALSGGAFFAPSFASAADVTIDSTHPPQRNVPNPDDPSTPNSAASVGTGSEDASGNSLTVDRYQEDTLSVFGGVARGTGNADGNTVRIKGATTEIASVYGGAAWGIGHARENRVRFDAGKMSFAEWLVGGYIGRSGKAEENTVEVNCGKTESLYGGFSNSTNASGRIYKNHVIIRGGTVAGKVYAGAFGGAHATGDVTHNTVLITGGTLKKAVCGGSLEKADSTGNVAHNEVTNVSGGSKNLTNMTLDFRRSGAARKLQAGDSFTLLENASGKITVGEGVTMKGTDGIAHDCLFAIAPDKEHPEKLRATVTKTGVSETAKSPVETRAGLANFVNQGADYLVEIGFAAAELSAENASADDAAESRASAKDTQRRTAASDPASYHLWAGAGANAMRVESGSHVDSKGWNLGVGWAREDAAKDGTKRLFSPFVEYGRSTYDSYLDNGAYGSGKLSYLGLGVLGKLMQQDGLWLEASVRAGRAKSDYSLHGENAGYDGSNTYYGIHLGVGKTFALQKGASLDAYVRYFWSHQDGMSVKLRGSGDAYDFADVDSHRLRLGLRYSRKDKSTGECYAGLAWEYELGGEASASVGGDAAPSPSLKGSSYMLELGYRFLPQNSRVSYDFHINGWQGKRKGLSGGAVIRWAF